MFTTLNVRVILWATLALALLMNYVTWLQDYPPAPPAVAAAAPEAGGGTSAGGAGLGSTAPSISAPADAGANAMATGAPGAGAVIAPLPSTALEGAAVSATAPTVHIVTDVLDVQVALDGGELTRVDLPAYPQVKGEAIPEIGRAHV